MTPVAPCARCGHGADEHRLRGVGISGMPTTASVEIVDIVMGGLDVPRAIVGAEVMYYLPLAPPLEHLQGDCFKCGKPLNQHPVYEGTCYPVCRASWFPPGALGDADESG